MYGVGRRIWNPKDEGTWEHDLFNELTINESLRDGVNTFFSFWTNYISAHSKSLLSLVLQSTNMQALDKTLEEPPVS
jgi:hypothetical protein